MKAIDSAFAAEMKGKMYGADETDDAKAWFVSGWDAALRDGGASASPAVLTGDMRKLLTHALFWMGRVPISKESTDGMNAVRADVEALLLAASPADQERREFELYEWKREQQLGKGGA